LPARLVRFAVRLALDGVHAFLQWFHEIRDTARRALIRETRFVGLQLKLF
jgi:hypothetical protein